jgi:hypothetical protein
MESPQVADGGNGLQIWKIVANILNKQSPTADKGWSSRSGVGDNNSPLKNKRLTKCQKSILINIYKIMPVIT